ncbi:WD repeat domain phosphoinositide-interacting protein [Piedraia hortae CBS 480.64]|uniref:WD repeat domain phosphoinositide-interacting protein n=1 Tax=Piedraia hortae CBS 480.64 TaxID=1314780 RepID=A0A6A7C558_9PEZI|nr:WD repeat domain phosphoinositide-interacting protein [Piedraia hortae CBS 480.64]
MARLNYLAFNQDNTSLALATTNGLRIFNTDPFELTTATYDHEVSLAEQLFSTSLVATVVTPRLLRIVNTKRHTTICELTFHGMIVAVRMNRMKLVTVLEEVFFVYDISNMSLQHQQETPLNSAGICALSTQSKHNFLALPHYADQPKAFNPSHVPPSIRREAIGGEVAVFDLDTLQEVAVVSAHQAPLSCLAMNGEGTLLATASEKGTVIRIFSIPKGQKVCQFRRGSMPARIFSMSFNVASTLLCVSSATETVHVFKLSSLPERSTSPASDAESALSESQPGFMSFVKRTSQNVSTGLVSRAAGYLPSSVAGALEPQRDFAWMRVPRGKSGTAVRSVVAMCASTPHVMVATNEGDFFVFAIDLAKGGEGTLLRQFDDIHIAGKKDEV